MGFFSKKSRSETANLLDSLAKQSSSSEQRQKLGGGKQAFSPADGVDQLAKALAPGSAASTQQLDQLSSVASLANEILKPTESKSDTWSMNITGGTELSFADDQLTVYVQNESEAAAPNDQAVPSKATVSQPQDAAAPIQPDQAEHHADDAGKQVPDPIVKSVDNTDAATASQAEVVTHHQVKAAGASATQQQSEAPAVVLQEAAPQLDNQSTLKSTGDQYHEALKQNSILITQIAVLQKINEQLSTQIEQWHTYRSKTTVYIKDLMAKHQATLADFESNRQAAEEAKTLRSQNEALLEKEQTLQDQVANLTQQLTTTKADLTKQLEAAKTDLANQLETAQSDRDKALNAKSDLQNELSKQIVAEQIAETDLKHAQEDLAAAKQAQQQLEAELTKLRAERGNQAATSVSSQPAVAVPTAKALADSGVALNRLDVLPSSDVPVFESDFPEA